MADAVKGHGRTVPVMAVACTPLLLQGLNYTAVALHIVQVRLEGVMTTGSQAVGAR